MQIKKKKEKLQESKKKKKKKKKNKYQNQRTKKKGFLFIQSRNDVQLVFGIRHDPLPPDSQSIRLQGIREWIKSFVN